MKTAVILVIFTVITGLFSLSCKKEQPPAENRSTGGAETPVNIINHKYDTQLVDAVNKKDYTMVRKLLIQGAYPDAKNKHGVPVLILAAYNGAGWIAEMLLLSGANVNAVDRDGDTALHNAVYRDEIQCVYRLLNHDADINIRNRKGKTPLQISAEMYSQKSGYSYKEIYNALMMVHSNRPPIIEAIRRNNIHELEKLLKSGVNPDTPIYRFHVGMGASDNFVKVPAYFLAIRKNNTAILALLLKRTRLLNFSYESFILNPPHKIENAMIEAAKVKNIKIMKLLMRRGINKSIAEGGLIYAVSINELELVKEFVKYGVDVNCNSYYLKDIPILRDEPIFSRAKAILIAIKNGNGAIVEYLLRKNVDIVVRSGIGAVRNFSPLGYAFEMKNSEIIKMMINLSSKSKYSGFHDWCCGKSETILMLAIKNCPELVSFVLSKGENVNIANENSETALMRASEYNRIEAVKLLILAGAKVNAKDSGGNTPLSIAKSKNHSEIVKLLVAAGARE